MREKILTNARYHEILFMIDTCQANTMYSKLYSPNIIATGSSELDQSSYSHHADNDVGVAVIDRYTYYNLEFLEGQVRDMSSKKTVGDLFDSYDVSKIHSNPGFRYDLFPGGEEAARKRLITDFFGNVQGVEVAGGNATEGEEELLGLSRAIAELRRAAEEEELAARGPGGNASEAGAGSRTWAERVEVRPAKMLSEENYWAKKIYGATAVAGCALLWGISSYMEAA